MKKNNLLLLLLLFTAFIFTSCSGDDDENDYVPVSPVVLDVTQVPYPKLSDYKFFEGEMKNQVPSYKVLPYRPASELFSDYAHKKRFVWMPAGTKASHDGADNSLNFPVGAVLIKTFYYDNVMPGNTTKIIETRILIKKREVTFNDMGTENNSGWETYNYIWNAEQTEAYLDTDGNGIFVPVTWNENGVERTIEYKVPAFTECITCHKLNPNQTSDGELTIPIGVKPQNLNNNFTYGSTQMNQLQKWIDEGYLENNLPSSISSTVDWRDTSKSLELRARSYIDINCAHCHRDGGHCDYVDMKFNFSNTNMQDFGVCMVPLFNIENSPFVINAGHSETSELSVRIGSVDQSIMMPIIGRTIVHDEGVALINAWINTLTDHCE